MTRPRKGEIFIHKNLTLEANISMEFEEIVGQGNVSEDIRNYMKRKVEAERKKEEASIDPLNLPELRNNNNNNNIYECLENIEKEITFQIKKCDNIKDSKYITKKLEELRVKSERDRALKINRGGMLNIAN